MLCNACGMDSKNTHSCEWCHKPMVGGRQGSQPLDQTQAVAPPVIQRRMSLTGEEVEVAVPPPSYAPPQAYQPPTQNGAGRPPSVVPPGYSAVRNLPSGAINPELMRMGTTNDMGAVQNSPMAKWDKCLAMCLPVMLISIWIIHKSPANLPWITLGEMFLVALFMGASAAIPSYDDAFLDVGIFLVVCFFFGPLIALVVYGIVGAIKQEFNVAILSLLLGHLIVRFLNIYVALSVQDSITGMISAGVLGFVGMFAVCATFAGWILSSFFRPINE